MHSAKEIGLTCNGGYNHKDSGDNVDRKAPSTKVVQRWVDLVLLESTAAPNEQHNDGERIRNVEEDGAACGVCAERNSGPEIEKTKADVEDEAEPDSPNRNIERW